jgi:hypothetical protein
VLSGVGHVNKQGFGSKVGGGLECQMIQLASYCMYYQLSCDLWPVVWQLGFLVV